MPSGLLPGGVQRQRRACSYAYAAGTGVALTAVPNEGKAFKKWTIFDPNCPGDANYAVEDTNEVLHLTMDTHQEVKATFKCGSGVEQALPLLIVGVAVCGLVPRRFRRRDC